MDFKYSFHQMKHSNFVEKAVEDKIGHSMRFLFGQATAHVTVSRRGYEFNIEISVSGRGNVYFKASACAENLYAAIDLVQDKLEKQFIKNRKKLQNHKRPELSKKGRLEHLDASLSTDFRPRWKKMKKAA